MNRYAAKVDTNQEVIVRALRKVGATVKSLHRVGEGCPDLLVGYRRRTFLLEVKDGSRPPSERKLTPDQVEFIRLWQGMPVAVVVDVEQALVAIGAVAKETPRVEEGHE